MKCVMMVPAGRRTLSAARERERADDGTDDDDNDDGDPAAGARVVFSSLF